jgi:hypothetical protein
MQVAIENHEYYDSEYILASEECVYHFIENNKNHKLKHFLDNHKANYKIKNNNELWINGENFPHDINISSCTLLIRGDFVNNVIYEKTLKITDIDEIINIFKHKKTLADIVDQIVGRTVDQQKDICRWGSYRHRFGQDLYDLLCYLSDECLISDNQIYKLFELKLENTIYESYNIFEHVRTKLLELKTHENNIDPYEEYLDDVKELKLAKTIDDLMIHLKHCSRDLNNAVYDIFNIIYPNAKIVLMKQKIQLNEYEGYNYDANDTVYSQISLGFKCWILKQRKLIKNDTSFRNFDT